ncbi:MAG: isoprenylcysteine carboxylmethyltransferase family protein [Clostridia bacterium]|nr:isoprenylcysteine carboxylmethyltransferase family protein [Clostridia bacterium]
MKLLLSALSKALLGFLLICLLLFFPAGTIHYPGGVRFLLTLFIPMAISGIILFFKYPDLLKNRLKAKEKQKEQSLYVKLSGCMFLLGFISAGISYRLGFLLLPKGFSIAGCIVFVVFYLMYFEVLRENVYLSRTIEVQKHQKVIDTGLYSVIRHPMYTATIFMFLSVPFILSSLLSLFFFLFYPLIIVLRLKNEEKVLENGLEGYSEYKTKTKYRLLPFIW